VSSAFFILSLKCVISCSPSEQSVDVPSIVDFSKKISTGDKVVMPKIAIPGIGYLAVCEDIEGNSFGIIQNDRNAKIDTGRPVKTGSCRGGCCWQKVTPLLRKQSHEVYTPTLTGLGERSHVLRKDIDLDIHIQDITRVFKYEDLNEVILLGHSYGGMVIGGAAEKIPDRIKPPCIS
jgi:hypothetical protein